MQVKKISKSVTNLGYDTGMLSVCFENLNYTNEELYKILSGIKKKVKYVKLNKDTIIDVNSIEAEKLAAELVYMHSLHGDLESAEECGKLLC